MLLVNQLDVAASPESSAGIVAIRTADSALISTSTSLTEHCPLPAGESRFSRANVKFENYRSFLIIVNSPYNTNYNKLSGRTFYIFVLRKLLEAFC